MTENQKELAAKPQFDWDGYIIPHIQAAVGSNKLSIKGYCLRFL